MFPDDINWFKPNLGHFGQKMVKLKCIFLSHQMESMGIHIGYNILHMPLVRFYVDYFDGFGKLRDIYFA